MKSMKKLMLVGLVLLASVVVLAGCKNDSVPEVPKYTVKFETNHGTTPKELVVESGTKLTAEQLQIEAEVEDNIFLYWYDKDAPTLKVEAGYSVTKNVTLVAKWGDIHDVIMNIEGNSITWPVPITLLDLDPSTLSDLTSLSMPNTFMNDGYDMCTDETISEEITTLSFQPISATLRFNVTNYSSEPRRVNSITVNVVDDDGKKQPVATEKVYFNVLKDTSLFSLSDSFHEDVIADVSTDIGPGESVTFYALVLPLSGDAPLEGKKVRFTLDLSNPDELLFYELDAGSLATDNNAEYNWVSGKTYNIDIDFQ